MAATIRRLIPRADRLRREQAAKLREALIPFEREMPSTVGTLLHHIDRETAAQPGWTFIMLSPDQNSAVIEYLAAHSSRPVVAMRLWATCFQHLRPDTGEVVMSRDELAAQLSVSADHVSAVMGELEGVGAIIRRRERIAGMRGPGRVRYYLNPVVGTHLGGAARDKAQASAPPGPALRSIQGGKGA
jgi:hypothetical protein